MAGVGNVHFPQPSFYLCSEWINDPIWLSQFNAQGFHNNVYLLIKHNASQLSGRNKIFCMQVLHTFVQDKVTILSDQKQVGQPTYYFPALNSNM